MIEVADHAQLLQGEQTAGGRAHTPSRVDPPVGRHQLHPQGSAPCLLADVGTDGGLQSEDEGLSTTSKVRREVSLGFKGAIQAVVEFERLKLEAAAVRPLCKPPNTGFATPSDGWATRLGVFVWAHARQPCTTTPWRELGAVADVWGVWGRGAGYMHSGEKRS